MFPLRDTIQSRSFPFVNYLLIAFNALAFLLATAFGRQGFNNLIHDFGMIPARVQLVNPLSWGTLLTSMFLHGSWFHLISNMWTLFIFGDNVEDRMGHLRYLAFYLITGFSAGAAHVFFGGSSTVPTVGASGAIAGVLGAYFILFPRARVVTLFLFFLFPWFVNIPAFIYLGFWFFSQLSSGLLNIGSYGSFGGIAWWAHIGGFVVGVLLVRSFARRSRLVERTLDDWL